MKTVIYLLSFLFIIFCACTRGFKNMNTDKNGITEENMKIDYNNLGIPLNIIQQGIYFNYDFGKGKNWPYQIMQNLSADIFCGYFHDYKPLNGGSNNSDYNLQDGWNSSMWENTYSYIFPQIKKSEDSTRNNYPQFYAITKILKVMVMHRVSDYYGPVIYSNFGIENTNYTPESQQEVYYTFFNDLDTAVHLLTHYHQDHPEAREFSQFDLLLDGKYTTWIRLANSLRLRLALRLASVKPVKGSEETLKALNNPFGVFENSKEVVAVKTNTGYTNPLGEINRNWGEVFMNANMESILVGYHDPRLQAFFEPCKEDVILSKDTVRLKDKYKGIRQGTMFAHTLYSGHSTATINQSTPAILMTAAEMWFLRAEAALRNWTEEDCEECYRRGISTSFDQWDTDLGLYMLLPNQAKDYTDAFNPEYNIKARCQVPPTWNNADDKETKLEKIITQKWIALFPESCEAWAEQRRTGYPRLFPVKYNNSPGQCIDTEIMIRRLNFPGKLQDTDPQLYHSLLELLKGPDHAGTRLWWDTGKNF